MHPGFSMKDTLDGLDSMMKRGTEVKAPDQLTTTCQEMLDEAGIEPFGDRRLIWHMPPEIIEDHMEPGMENRMFGYPVVMEVMLGEETIVLTETVAVRQVPQPART